MLPVHTKSIFLNFQPLTRVNNSRVQSADLVWPHSARAARYVRSGPARHVSTALRGKVRRISANGHQFSKCQSRDRRKQTGPSLELFRWWRICVRWRF
jgi:hypothetical protein